jgi:hypothetical protein
MWLVKGDWIPELHNLESPKQGPKGHQGPQGGGPRLHPKNHSFFKNFYRKILTALTIAQ